MENVIARLVDSSIGTWKLDLERSKRMPASATSVASLVMETVRADEGVMSIVTGQFEDGTPIRFAGPIKFDGKEYPVTGAPWDIYSFTAVDARTSTFVDRKAGGKFHVVGRQVISEDGRTLTITSEGTDADGAPVAALQIYEKQ